MILTLTDTRIIGFQSWRFFFHFSAGKIASVSNGTYGRISRKPIDNSNSTQSLSSSSGVSSVKSSNHGGVTSATSTGSAGKSQVSSTIEDFPSLNF